MARCLTALLALVVVTLAGTPAAAQDDVELSTFLYSDTEARDLFRDHPEWGGEAAEVPFELSTVEGDAELEVSATPTEVVGAWTSVVFSGEVAGCPARMRFGASSEAVSGGPVAGTFVVAMSGSWQFHWTTRDAPEDQCRHQFVVSEPLEYDLTIGIAESGPVVVVAAAVSVPRAAIGAIPAQLGTDLATTVPQEATGSAEPAADGDAAPGEGMSFALVFIQVLLLVLVGVAVLLAFIYAFRRYTGGPKTALDDTLADVGMSTDEFSLDEDDEEMDALQKASRRLERRR